MIDSKSSEEKEAVKLAVRITSSFFLMIKGALYGLVFALVVTHRPLGMAVGGIVYVWGIYSTIFGKYEAAILKADRSGARLAIIGAYLGAPVMVGIGLMLPINARRILCFVLISISLILMQFSPKRRGTLDQLVEQFLPRSPRPEQ